MSTEVVASTTNCSVVLDEHGFYARCNAPGCTWVSERAASKATARRWANEHEDK